MPSPVVLYAGAPDQSADWARELSAAARLEEIEVDLRFSPAAADPAQVDYILFAPVGAAPDLRPYTKLKAILSLWAGVETIIARDDLPPDVPIARMVEPGLTIGMTDYVVGHVLRRHLDLDATLARHAAARWDATHPPLSIQRRVGVMGLGALGRDAAEKLAALRFDVRGWSRAPKDIPGVRCWAGLETLEGFLSEIEILVVLLPLTPQTRGVLDARRLAQLPEGAYLINAARGPIIDEAALLSALDTRLGGATLDVFDEEPLPAGHPLWSAPNVTVTPHIASVTRPETAAMEVMRQIKRSESGLGLHHLVDTSRGY